MNVLVIEDDPHLAVLAAKVLERRGISVSTAVTGAEGIDEAIRGDFEVILLDLRLSDIDGYQVAAQVKAAKPEIAIIACSANVMDEDRLKALQSGCDAFLGKPYSLTDLISSVEALQ